MQRGPRGTRLTQAGAVLDRHAAIVLGQLAAARAELDDLARLRGGALRMAAFESAWTALVPAAVSAYRERLPEVELQLAESDPADAVADVRAGACDLALVFEPNPLDAAGLDGLQRTVLARDPLWAVLPDGHALAATTASPLRGWPASRGSRRPRSAPASCAARAWPSASSPTSCSRAATTARSRASSPPGPASRSSRSSP